MRKVLAVTLFLVALLPATAKAHASYKASDPANRSKVGTAPASLWAEFTEPLATGSYLHVYDPCGQRVDNGDTEISGYRMSVTQTGTRAGTYTVRFRALSTLDPHEVNGSFTFTATDGEPCPGSEPDPEPQPEEKEEAEAPPGENDGGGSGETPVASQEQPDSPDGGDGKKASKPKADRNGKVFAAAGSKKGSRVRVLAARRDRSEPGLLEGIPVGSLAVALIISALIGAAGGKVYAGIMGPRA